MPWFMVGIREVHESLRLVEANNEEDAVERADAEGEEVTCEYSHTLEKDLWTVEPADPPPRANAKEQS